MKVEADGGRCSGAFDWQTQLSRLCLPLLYHQRLQLQTDAATSFCTTLSPSDLFGKALDTLKVPRSLAPEAVGSFVLGAGDEGKSRAELEEEWHLRFKALETIRFMCYAPGDGCREALRPYVTYLGEEVRDAI